MTKRVPYKDLLKQAISEFDTSKAVDVKGPFLDPILAYDGGGELPTHKDASSILERYYFKEKADPGVNVEHVDDVMPEVAPKEDGAVKKLTKDIATAVTKPEADGHKEAQKTKLGEGEEEAAEEEVVAEEEVITTEIEDMENAVIEKLIGEMEQELEEADFTKDEDNTEPAGVPKKDKAGTVPSRDDLADKFTKPAQIDKPKAVSDSVEIEPTDKDEVVSEQDAEEEPEEEKPLDVDKETKTADEKKDEKEAKKDEKEAKKDEKEAEKDVKEESVGPGLRNSNEEDTGARELDEQFEIFKEAIEEEEVAEEVVSKDIDPDEIRV